MTNLADLDAKGVKLASPDAAPDPVEYWTLSDKEQARLGRELPACMNYNPASFGLTDIERVVVLLREGDNPEDQMGDEDWEWFVYLKDKRRFFVTAWHDYTGWDCRSGATYIEVLVPDDD